MPFALMLLLAGLASARTYRVMTVDGIGDPVRNLWYKLVWHIDPPVHRRIKMATLRRKNVTRLEWRRYKVAKSLGEMYECRWCLGYWVSLAWVAMGMAWGETWPWQLAAGSLSISYLLGLLGAVEPDQGNI